MPNSRTTNNLARVNLVKPRFCLDFAVFRDTTQKFFSYSGDWNFEKLEISNLERSDKQFGEGFLAVVIIELIFRGLQSGFPTRKLQFVSETFFESKICHLNHNLESAITLRLKNIISSRKFLLESKVSQNDWMFLLVVNLLSEEPIRWVFRNPRIVRYFLTSNTFLSAIFTLVLIQLIT